jgi:hypothetical protein
VLPSSSVLKPDLHLAWSKIELPSQITLLILYATKHKTNIWSNTGWEEQ